MVSNLGLRFQFCSRIGGWVKNAGLESRMMGLGSSLRSCELGLVLVGGLVW